jgi:trans-aconitate methyltransferase
MFRNAFNRLSRWGFVYWTPATYRWTMALLRPNGRTAMFNRILEEIGDDSVLELCCGEGELIRRLKRNPWTGIDKNLLFVESIRVHGWQALQADILSVKWPEADCLVMVDSLYHFTDNIDDLMKRLLTHPAKKIILSESVKHMAHRPEQWIVRFIHWGTRVDGRVFPGRFTEESMRQLLNRYGFQTIERCGENMIGILVRPRSSSSAQAEVV